MESASRVEEVKSQTDRVSAGSSGRLSLLALGFQTVHGELRIESPQTAIAVESIEESRGEAFQGQRCIGVMRKKHLVSQKSNSKAS